MYDAPDEAVTMLEDVALLTATPWTVSNPSELHGLTGDPRQRTLCSWTHDV